MTMQQSLGDPEISTLIQVLDAGASRSPHARAFHFAGRGDWTWRALRQRVDTLARALDRTELAAGAPVLLALPNSPEFLFTFFAILRTGRIPAPHFPASSPSRLARQASRCGAAGIVRLLPHDPLPDGWVPLGQGLCLQQPPFEGEPLPTRGVTGLNPAQTALVQFTSGSTGWPTAIQISHSALFANIRQMGATWKFSSRDSFVNWLPLYHDMGLVLMTLTPLILGCPLILMPTGLQRIQRWFRLIRDHGGTVIAAPDFVYRFSLTYISSRQSGDLSSLRIAVNAAESVRFSTIRRFESTFALPGVMRPAYGLAEATAGVCGVRIGEPVLTDSAGNVNVGKPFPGIRIRIDTTDQDGRGEIQVHTPAATSGTIGTTESSRNLFTEGGWLRTGDLGSMDPRGGLIVLGRIRHTLRQDGHSLGTREVEECMDNLVFVRRSAAIGIDFKGMDGEQIVIFLELKQPSDQVSTRRDVAAESVREFHHYFGFRPGKIMLLPPRGIPLTVNGKTCYSLLEERFRKGGLNCLDLFPSSGAT